MIAFGFYQAAVERRQLRINCFQLAREYLKFFATSAFNQAAAD